MSDATFNGVFEASGSADKTHFTVNMGLDTRNGATTSATGGTVVWYQANSVTWSTPPTGVFEVLVYGCRSCSPGSEVLLAASYPSIDSDYPATQWDDFGPTISGSLNVPWWAPTSPQSSAQADPLQTTITAGAGMMTLSLADKAKTSVTNAPVRFDNAATLLAAATAGGQLHFPESAVGNGCYVLNSNLDLHSLSSYSITSLGSIYLNGTLWLRNGARWYGDRFLASGNTPQFGFEGYSTVEVGAGAYPGVYEHGNGGLDLRGLNFSDNSTNGGIDVLIDNGGLPAGILQDVAFTGASYASIPVICRGCSHWKVENVTDVTGPDQINGSTSTPSFWCNQCGLLKVDNFSFNRRGILLTTTISAADDWDITFGRIQGNITPWITVEGPPAAGTISANLRIDFTQLDTTFYPTVDYLPSAGQTNLSITSYGGYGPTGGYPFLSGNPIAFSNICSGNNISCITSGKSYGFGYLTFGGAPALSFTNWGTGGSVIGYQFAAPLAPTLSLSRGGHVPLGQHRYQLLYYDAFGNFSPVGAPASITTTTGNQTVNITPTNPQPGVAGYTILRDGLFLANTANICSSFFGPNGVGTSQDILASECSNIPPSYNNGVSAGVGGAGLAAGAVKLTGNGFTDTITGRFTNNREQQFADVSGIVPVSGYQNSVYDNFNRPNGGLGSNWTAAIGSIQISNNAAVATSLVDSDASAITALANGRGFASNQFSEATVSALHGTTDFVGSTINYITNGSGYACIEDTTTVALQLHKANSRSNLGTAAVTGAAGDVLRIERNGSTLSCYQNGALKVTASDTTFTAGAPGIFTFSSGTPSAALDNWSGGNLHPIAQLDMEQDWTQVQHFPRNGGTCRMAGGITCTATVAQPSTPDLTHCVVSLQGTGTVMAAECSVSGTTVTVTAASPNSGQWAFWIF